MKNNKKKTNKNKVPRGTLPQETDLQRIGRELRISMLDQKLTFVDVSKKSGVTTLTISKLMNGDLENTSIQTIEKICSALGYELKMSIE